MAFFNPIKMAIDDARKKIEASPAAKHLLADLEAIEKDLPELEAAQKGIIEGLSKIDPTLGAHFATFAAFEARAIALISEVQAVAKEFGV